MKKLKMTTFILIYLLNSSYSNAMIEEDPDTPQVKRLLFRQGRNNNFISNNQELKNGKEKNYVYYTSKFSFYWDRIFQFGKCLDDAK